MEGLKMNKISKEELEEVINEFQYEGKLVFIKPYNRPAGEEMQSPFGGWRHHLSRGCTANMI